MERYIPCLPKSDEKYVRSYRASIPYGSWIIKEQCREIARTMSIIEEIYQKYADTIIFGIFEIDIKSIKNLIITKSQERINLFKLYTANDINLYSSGLNYDLKPVTQLLQKRPKNTDELQKMQNSLFKEEPLKELITVNINRIKRLLEILEDFHTDIPPKYIDEFINVLKWPVSITDSFDNAKLLIPECISTFTVYIRHQQLQIRKSIEEIQVVIEKICKYGIEKIDHSYDVYDETMKCEKDLIELDHAVKKFNKDENILHFDITLYPEIGLYRSQVAPLLTLWQNIINWEEKYPEWMDGNIQKLPQNLNSQINFIYKSACSLETTFESHHLDGPKSVSKILQEQCLNFREFVPLISMVYLFIN